MTLLQAIEHWQINTAEFWASAVLLGAGAVYFVLRWLDESTKPECDKDRI